MSNYQISGRKSYGGRLQAVIVLITSGILFVSACFAGETTQTKTTSDDSNMITDKPLAEFQSELLDIAFEIASAIEIKPFIKDRCRTQQEVIEAYIKLEQYRKAIKKADEIKNWRRGYCYADVAYHLVEKGHDLTTVQKGLEIAEQIAGENHGQQWRSDRIKARIAQTFALLGQTDKFTEFSKDIVSSERDKIVTVNAKISDENFAAQTKSLDALLAFQGFETTIQALQGYAALFGRYYENVERRELSENKIKSSWSKIPFDIRIDLLLQMAGVALKYNDKNKASNFVDEAGQILANQNWDMEHRLPKVADIVKMRFKAGNQDKALEQADTALAMYDENGDTIVDIYRAESIRPLAEAYMVIGHQDKAISVYKRAIEAGMVNRNHRPRAEDLSATCCSMALYAVEPNAQLWKLIQIKKEELVHP